MRPQSVENSGASNPDKSGSTPDAAFTKAAQEAYNYGKVAKEAYRDVERMREDLQRRDKDFRILVKELEEAMKSLELKIKVKALAAEARFIRKEELECLAWARDPKRNVARERLYREYENLHNHRIETVRRASRTVHLVRGFLKGMPYRRIERTCHEDPNLYELEKLVAKYGGPDVSEMNRNERLDLLVTWLSPE